VTPDTAAAYVRHIQTDMENGMWDQQFGSLRGRPCYEGSLRLIVSRASGSDTMAPRFSKPDAASGLSRMRSPMRHG
jgi:hypothetical protein